MGRERTLCVKLKMDVRDRRQERVDMCPGSSRGCSVTGSSARTLSPGDSTLREWSHARNLLFLVFRLFPLRIRLASSLSALCVSSI